MRFSFRRDLAQTCVLVVCCSMVELSDMFSVEEIGAAADPRAFILNIEEPPSHALHTRFAVDNGPSATKLHAASRMTLRLCEQLK